MFDKEAFSKIIQDIISNYESQREFAKVSSINRTYLSQYINKKIDSPPKPEMLKRLSNNSKGLVDYDTLMKVCGYIKNDNHMKETLDKQKLELEKKLNNIQFDQDEKKHVEKLANIIEEVLKYFKPKYKFIIDIPKNEFDEKYRELSKDLKMHPFSFTAMGFLKINKALKLIIHIKAIELDMEHINDFQNFINESTNNTTKVPVLGSIPAGIPIELIEDILDYEDISEEMLKGGKEYFALKVKGSSMWPKYLDGDTIIVLKQDDCESGQDAIVMVNGNDGTFKRVIKKDNGITLEPINQQEYNSVSYSNEDIEKLPIKILGVVKEIRRKI
mgnify:FL=1|nr:MAG TPA: SOS-response transcriptional repressors (RecA-mediated autopeptidases) [Caudoviricetes sp.]